MLRLLYRSSISFGGSVRFGVGQIKTKGLQSLTPLTPSYSLAAHSSSTFADNIIVIISPRRTYGTTSILSMPMKDVEIFTLGSSSSKKHKSGELVDTPLLEGSFVEVGDIVGIVKVGNDDNNLHEIPSPSTGRIVKIHADIGSEITVGDVLVTIDTDALQQDGTNQPFAGNSNTPPAATASTTSSDQEKVMQNFVANIQNNQNTLDDSSLKELINSIDDPHLLRSLAAILMDRFPNLKVKALPLLEQVLELQRAQVKEAAKNAAKIMTPEQDSLFLQEQATTHTDLGILLYQLGDLDAALTQLECALELRSLALGESHPELSATLIHIGAIKNKKQDLDGCFEAFERALSIQKQHLGEDHVLVAASLNNLGAICYHKGDYQRAIPYYQEALNIYKKQQASENSEKDKSGEFSPDTAGSYNNLAVAVKHTGDYSLAIDYARKALSIRLEVLGKEHLDTATSHYCLGQIFTEIRHFDAALEQFDAALEIQSQQLGAQHPTTATTHNNIGATYYEQGNFDKSLEEYKLGLEGFQTALGEEAPQVADCWNNVGMAQTRLGDFEAALESHQNAEKILKQSFGEKHPTLATTLASIGTVYKNMQEYDQAMDHYKTSHQMLEQAVGSGHDLVGSSYNNMGQVLALQGKLEDALTVYQAALSIFKKALSKDHVFTGSIHYNIGLVLQQQVDVQNNVQKSISSYREAYEIWEKALGPDHPQTKLAESAIEQLQQS